MRQISRLIYQGDGYMTSKVQKKVKMRRTNRNKLTFTAVITSKKDETKLPY